MSKITDDLTDESIFLQVRNGNSEMYGILYQRYKGPVAGMIMKMTGGAADLEDLVADVFLTAYQKRTQYKQAGSFKSWLYKIAVNMARQHTRKQGFRRRAMADLARGNGLPGPSDAPMKSQLERMELRDILMSSLSKIGPKLREVFVLRDVEELSYQEIAEILRCPVGTVKSRLSSARKAMVELTRESLNSQEG